MGTNKNHWINVLSKDFFFLLRFWTLLCPIGCGTISTTQLWSRAARRARPRTMPMSSSTAAPASPTVSSCRTSWAASGTRRTWRRRRRRGGPAPLPQQPSWRRRSSSLRTIPEWWIRAQKYTKTPQCFLCPPLSHYLVIFVSRIFFLLEKGGLLSTLRNKGTA